MKDVKRITVSSNGDVKVLQKTLKELRITKGITLSSYSLMGSNLARMENEKYDFNPTLRTLIKVLKVLGVKELLIKIEEENNETSNG